jgi:SAM-dependent methyltransferase
MREAYKQAFESGFYAKPTGLLGKYDNTRRYWEDPIITMNLRPYISKLLNEKNHLNILDIGCGGGDGYELLKSAIQKDPPLEQHDIALLPSHQFSYDGIDNNPTLIEQAKDTQGDGEGRTFTVCDITKGLPPQHEDKRYDLFLTTYGTLSHFDNTALEDTLAYVADISSEHSFVFCDFLGAYSYEWQNYWKDDLLREFFLDYRISYLYPPEEMENIEIESFPLRLVTPNEIGELLSRLENRISKRVKISRIYDRSMMMGRHIGTGEYNIGAQPIRKTINSLHEDYVRTNIDNIFFNYYPKKNFPKQNRFFKNFERCWNAVLGYFNMRISERINPVNFEDWHDYPPVVQRALMTVDRVFDSVSWMVYGDPRANIIEPQLGYTLRNLEIELSSGKGFGHSIVAILEITS